MKGNNLLNNYYSLRNNNFKNFKNFKLKNEN